MPLNSILHSGAIALTGLLLTQAATQVPAVAQMRLESPSQTEPEFFSAADRLEVAPAASGFQIAPATDSESLLQEQPEAEVAQAAPEPEPEPLPAPPPAIDQPETPVTPETLEVPEDPEVPEAEDRFGDRGDNRWYIQGATATHIDNQENGQFGMVGAGISHFFATRHSINGELNSFYFSQNDDDAVGLNLAVLIRSHLYRQPNWSLYFDGGVGILGTTSDVPSDGSEFNFTPQFGVGATIGLDNDQRLMVGVRYHHISNGDIYEDNPGRDSIMGYVGLNFPR